MSTATATLKSPYPYFGGKSRVAELIWKRFGDVPNFVEPFFGSGAVLLGRPHPPKTETVNDLNAFICNFWRAVKHDPASVAEHCSFPVNENHLHSVHRWLIFKVTEDGLRARIDADPDYFDVVVAGRWAWGMSSWIGSGWCKPSEVCTGERIHQKRPSFEHRGVHRTQAHSDSTLAYFGELSKRFQSVQACCGNWDRVLGPSATTKHGVTAVFLDPPYADEAERDERLYANDDLQVSHAVREWAIANGGNHQLRICLAGYVGEHALPESWECVEWKSVGTNDGNAHKERLWFSPHCIKPLRTRSLFDAFEGASS